MGSYTVADLPHLQAMLNASTLVLLLTGFYFIRNSRRKAHIVCMLCATLISVAFLVSYLTYHAAIGFLPFQGKGIIRLFYFSVLSSHVILAALNVPLVLITLLLAASRKFSQHRRLARWVLPVWIYVSVTGLLVYLFAFHLYPQPLQTY